MCTCDGSPSASWVTRSATLNSYALSLRQHAASASLHANSTPRYGSTNVAKQVPSERLFALPASCRTVLAQRRIDGGELIYSAAGGELLEVLTRLGPRFGPESFRRPLTWAFVA